MFIYTLDSLLRRENLIDRFISCIWTERFAESGDFQLILESTPGNRNLFSKGTLLACNLSNYVMKVLTTEDSVDDDGRPSLKITGTSVESMLKDRVAALSLTNTTTTPYWEISGVPAVIARKIFHDICVTGTLSVNDKIPFIYEGTFLPNDNIPEPVDPITVQISPQTVYDAIKSICDTWSLGFRILRQGDLSRLYFDIYSGSDRTASQTILPAVVFTPELDNLQNTTELTSIDDYKNVAYVFSPDGFEVVFPQDVNPDVAGFERSILVVDANDITTESVTNVSLALIQRGNEELAKHRSYAAFDGEISNTSNYKYGRDYYLGDLVDVRNKDGVTNQMRVTEQIFVSDSEGERSYPTLAINLFIDTGTWLAWDNNQVWQDVPDTTFWANA